MKILAAADIHGKHDWLESLVAAAIPLDAQAIVLAGDLLGYAPGYPKAADAQRADAAKLLTLLGASPVPVLYVLGNDDLVELGPDAAPLCSIHGRRIDLGPFNFVGYRFTLPFMAGEFEKPEEAIARDLEALAPFADDRTVFVTHSPAQGHLDLTMLGVQSGSASIRTFIDRTGVLAHIHGHIHACFGRDGRHFNVAALPSAKAMLIKLDDLSCREIGLAAIEKPRRLP